MIIFVVYEWCYVILAVMLHNKIKRAGSLLLACGLATTAALVTLRFFGPRYNSIYPMVKRVIPMLSIIVPLFSLTGLAMIVAKWDEYVSKK